MGFIGQVYSELQNGVKAKGQRFADLFELAPLIEKSSNSFKSDLLKINELKPLFDEWWANRGSTEGIGPC